MNDCAPHVHEFRYRITGTALYGSGPDRAREPHSELACSCGLTYRQWMFAKTHPEETA